MQALTDHGWTFWRRDRRTSSIGVLSGASYADPDSFDVHPNPRVRESASSSFVLLDHIGWEQVAYTAVTVAASAMAWRLYQRWRADPEQEMLRQRARLAAKLHQMRDSNDEDITSPSKLRKKKSSLRRSPVVKKSFLSSLFSAAPAASPSPSPSAADGSTSADSDRPSAAEQISNSEKFRAFLVEAKRLATQEGIIIPDPTAFYLKRERMRASNLRAMADSKSGCDGNLHLLCTFDRTLTTLKRQAMVRTHVPHRAAAATAHLPPPPPPPAAASSAYSLTSQSLLNSSLPSSYDAAFHALFRQYYPQEASPHIDAATKDAYMREWWRRCHALLCLDEYQLTRNRLRHMVKSAIDAGHLSLRRGALDLLRQSGLTVAPGALVGLCDRYDIPVVIFSGSIHDCVEEVLAAHDVRVHNSNADLTHASDADRARVEQSRVMLVANRIHWSAPVSASVSDFAAALPSLDAVAMPASALLRKAAAVAAHSRRGSASLATSACIGFDHAHLVHSLNKTYHRLLERPQIIARVADKTNVLLIGNTVADAAMADGAELRSQMSSPLHQLAAVGDVLRVGFLNDHATPERLAAFSAAYDVVILDDADLTFITRLTQYICGEEERDQMPIATNEEAQRPAVYADTHRPHTHTAFTPQHRY